MLRQNVGIIDISNFGKYICRGNGAHEFVDRIFANKIPEKVGASCLSPIIGKMGGISADATITKINEPNNEIGKILVKPVINQKNNSISQ